MDYKYKCPKCGYLFDEPWHKSWIEHHMPGVDEPWGADLCPYCGDPDFEEVEDEQDE